MYKTSNCIHVYDCIHNYTDTYRRRVSLCKNQNAFNEFKFAILFFLTNPLKIYRKKLLYFPFLNLMKIIIIE